MTDAILSFTTPGYVTLRCESPRIDERRPLEPSPPFERWSRAYAAGAWSAEGLLAIGLAISRWIDEPLQWLAQLRRQAIAPVILSIETSAHPIGIEKAAFEAPWELIANLEPGGPAAPTVRHSAGATHPEPIMELLRELGPVDLTRARHLALASDVLLTPVRRLGRATPRLPPSGYRLSVAFMAAQPHGLLPLAADREETAIRQAAGEIGMDLAVEDCGNLEGLAELVARVGECDVIQISCHGAGGDPPILALEDKRGGRVDVTAEDLSYAFGHKPRLLFLSACSTAAAVPAASAPTDIDAQAVALGSKVVWPLSSDLCWRGWPAVLGWSGSVSDLAAIQLARALYQQLALRVPLAEALAKARTTLAKTHRREWHQPRLFLNSEGGGQIVNGVRPRPEQPDFACTQEFLDPDRTIPLAPPGEPFLHRRASCHVIHALRVGDRSGVVIHGGDERARATFAGRVLRRLDRDLRRVVVTPPFDAPAILEAIRVQTAQRIVDSLAASHAHALWSDPQHLAVVLREILEGPCLGAGHGAFALVLHSFDPIMTSAPDPEGRRPLSDEQLVLARALIHAFNASHTASRLLFTSTGPFSVHGGNNTDLTASLLTVSL